MRQLALTLVFGTFVFTSTSVLAAPIAGTNCSTTPTAEAPEQITCSGIDFPLGLRSFADEVLTYAPLFGGGPGPTEPAAVDASSALGAPDFPPGGSPFSGAPGSVALGHGGLIELRFTDNLLTNSGDTLKDLHIFEIGSQVEDTLVAIRPTPATAILLGAGADANGDGFVEIGKVFGAISSIDIDNFFPSFAAGTLEFDAVQLVDDPAEGPDFGTTVGADIDSVGAISSVVPEPSTATMLLSGMLMLVLLMPRQDPS